MPPKSDYKHLDQRSQILLRPGQHIGDVSVVTKEVWICKDDQIARKEIEYNAGLVHLFNEALTNASDNYIQSLNTDTPLKKIEVTITPTSIEVWNDGKAIPTKKHVYSSEEENVGDIYEGELIFGHLNSSSNYDESKERKGGGLHGVGIKLANIFSQEFRVECFDPETGLKFVQTYSQNMTKRSKAKVTSLKKKTGWTQVSFTPDWERFSVSELSPDMIQHMKKMCYDTTLAVQGAKIVFNGEVIHNKNLLEYSKMFFASEERMELKSNNSQCILIAAEDGGQTIAYVNGVYTFSGGIHVDKWSNAIFAPLTEKLKTKFGKDTKLTVPQVKRHFHIMVNAQLTNPHFDGQTKSILLKPAPETNVPEAKLKNLMGWGFVKKLESGIEASEQKDLKKLDGKKVRRVHLKGYNEANQAGSNNSGKCRLFLTEGDSAATFVQTGISALKNGNDYNGTYALRGKILNVREVTVKKITENEEIGEIIKILGLRSNTNYQDQASFKSLRYGKVILLADADPDGDHIRGLLMNLFGCLYHSLLQSGFLMGMQTPLVKVSMNKIRKNFYTMKEFKVWEKKQTAAFKAEYYKGLGTNSEEEAITIFENTEYLQYNLDPQADDTLDMVFNKKRVTDRKNWLKGYKDQLMSYPKSEGIYQVAISDFLNGEFIEFANYDNIRSIPSVMDGFKPSQRKALFIGLKKLSSTEKKKVVPFASDVISSTEYHHGEVSMQSLIVKMAQTFVGSNNITYFTKDGQFGSRKQGGKDAAASRYLLTRLHAVARKMFRKEDDDLLEYLMEEGTSIEPKYFVPVIPHLLLNGQEGIGLGHSTTIPSFDPTEIIGWIREWLKTEKMVETPLHGWFNGFKGSVETIDKKIVTKGIFEKVSSGYSVKELPVGYWTDDFILVLNKWIEEDQITDYTNNSTPFDIDILLHTKKDLSHLLEKTLHCDVSLNNLVAFNREGMLTVYASPQEMLHEFCQVRLEFYVKRKKFYLEQLQHNLAKLKSKLAFIRLVVNNEYDLKNKSEEDLEAVFVKEKYHPDPTYRYLSDIPIRNFTHNKIKELEKEIVSLQQEIAFVQKTQPADIWRKELDEFVVAYGEWQKETKSAEETLKKILRKSEARKG